MKPNFSSAEKCQIITSVSVANSFKSSSGFSLIELIVVLAGLGVLTAIAATSFQRIFTDQENDAVQAHLNSLAVDCLKIQAINADSKSAMSPPTSVDTYLLNKNSYIENSDNSCKYFQINPKDSTSKTHFSMGFGIANGKVTKFAIKDSANTSGIVNACKSWAGEGNCLDNGSDYTAFFEHMDNVRIARATCNINLNTYLNTPPPPNPPDGGDKKTWDAETDKDCKNKTLPADKNSYSTVNCNTNGCNKEVKIKNGQIVGYNESDYQLAEALLCQDSISAYINGDYSGGSEIKTDLTGCTEDKYICDYSEVSKESYENCKIQEAISKCTVNLEYIRKNKPDSSNPYVVGASANQDNPSNSDLVGLPPCGQKVWVCKEVIYETKTSFDDSSCASS